MDSPSPASVPRPASLKGPTGPTLRANPFPEVTDLICRLPLPTLIYRLEAIHLGDLLRIWVRARPKVREGVRPPACPDRFDLVLRDRERTGVSLFFLLVPVDVRELTTPSEANSTRNRGSERVMRPWVSALACIFKDRRRRTGRRKNRGALRYHDPIALRVASRVTES